MRLLKIVGLVLYMGSASLSQGWAADTTVIAAFGDSLFAGYGLPPEDAFPAQLEKRLRADGYNVSVMNMAVSGDTTAGGLTRVDSVIQKNPNLIILELGGNDLLRGVNPADTRRNLHAIIDRIAKARIPLILSGMKAPFTLGAQFSEQYNTIYSELAFTYKVPLAPFILEGIYGKPGYMLPDGIHPTKEGVAIMVNNIYPTMMSALKK